MLFVAKFVALRSEFGWRFLGAIFVSQFVLKGAVFSLAATSVGYLLRGFGVTGAALQLCAALLFFPSSLKAAAGICLLAAALGSAATLLVGFAPADSLSLPVVGLCLFLLSCHVNCLEVVVQATMAERIRGSALGAELISFNFMCGFCGTALGLVLSGLVITFMDVQVLFRVGGALSLLSFWPLLGNWLEETRQSPQELARIQRTHEKAEVQMLILLSLGCVASMLTFSLLSNNVRADFCCDNYFQTAYSAVPASATLAAVLVGVWWLVRPEISRPNLFLVSACALRLSVEGAYFFFYTDPVAAFPEGRSLLPHYSPLTYITVSGLVGSAGSLAGVHFYGKHMAQLMYKEAFRSALLCKAASLLVPALQYSRLLAGSFWLGFFPLLLIDAFASAFAEALFAVAALTLVARLSPLGLEGSMSGLLVGFYNIGLTIARFFGVSLLSAFGVTPSGRAGETDEFDNLSRVALVCVACVLASLSLVSATLPDAGQSEALLVQNRNSACVSSPASFSSAAGSDQSSQPSPYNAPLMQPLVMPPHSDII